MQDVTNFLKTRNVTLVPAFLEKYCPKMLSAIDCLSTGIELVQPCFVEGEQKKTLDAIIPMMLEVQGFICNDDGKNVVGKLNHILAYSST